MNAEVKALWIRGLLSKEYEQGEGCLHSTHPPTPAFCCLGVLCDLAVKAGALPPPVLIGHRMQMVYGKGREAGNLPTEVMEWAGLNTNDGSYHPVHGEAYDGVYTCSLASDNDNGFSFAEIARIIEKHF
jgi:hypothetical protein